MHEVRETAVTGSRTQARRAPSARRAPAAQILAQQAAIAQIGQRALEELSLAELLTETCQLVRQVLEARLVSITRLSDDRTQLTIVAGEGWRAGVVGVQTLGTGSESQAGLTLSFGEPVIVPDYLLERRFKVIQSLLDNGARSGMTVRIGGADAPYGTLGVFASRPDAFSSDGAHFLHAIANILGAAVHRLEIEEQLRASRDQLAAIVSSIDEGITVQDHKGLLFANDEAARLSGYASAAEFLAAPNVIRQFEIIDEDGQPYPVDNLPGRRALRGEDSGEVTLRFRFEPTGTTHWASVRATGIRDGGGRVTHVINTFRNISDERWQREAREYMTDAVAILSSTLDTHEAAQRLADLSVPRFADYCTVTLLQPDRSIQLVALAHANPERVELVRRLEKTLPPTDPDAPTGVARVIREGTVDMGSVTPEMIDAAPATDEQKRMVHQIELSSYVTVPLRGRARPIGALTLAMAESGRRLGKRELALATELGERAGIALENAQLYQSADARRAELDAVLAALAEAVLVFNPAGKLRLGNEAATRLFDGRVPGTLDQLWQRAGGRPHGHDASATDGDLRDGLPMEIELDRHGRWLELRTFQAPTGGGGSGDGARGSASAADSPTVVVLRDVTDARAARAARDAFMGVLSHELRTPVTTIYGGSELLERDLGDERRREVIADIRAESERLARLVEDLLVMTRVERDIVEIADEPILLQHLLASVINAFAARSPGASIRLRTADRLPAVRGDATYVEQVVRNLLTNAMRYGDGMAQGIEVTAEESVGGSNEPDSVVVRVHDNGRGLGGEEPDKLFELFYRSSSARSVPGGAGIGLFVCHNLIEKMGGRMWASERPEGGAEFAFSLPVIDSDALS